MGFNRTLTILDVEYYGDNTVHKYGIDKAYSEFQTYLDIHNKLTQGQYTEIVAGETAEPRHRFDGGPDSIDMEDLELEMGTADIQAVGYSTYELGLPLKKFGLSQAWTERYLQIESVERFNGQLIASLDADVRRLRKEVGRSLFNNVNYTYRDRYVNGLDLTVRCLINADGTHIPAASDGTEFDGSTHTHYMVITAIDNAKVASVVTNLMEHYPEGGQPIIFVGRNTGNAMIAASGDTGAFSNFKPLRDGRILASALAERLNPGANPALDLYNVNDRQIGVMEDGPEVWVKPWMPEGYIFCIDRSKPKPVVQRRDPIEDSSLRIIEPANLHPKLKARTTERIIGFGVVNRINGVIAKIDSGNGAYSIPTMFS